jgi:CheY-like chemotaxis protein
MMTTAESGCTVLLVEDVAVNRRVAAAFLAKQGHGVVEAVSGSQALDAVEQRYFDLILLDIRLPDMDGVDVAGRIRAHTDPLKASVPILALTANVFPDDIKRYRDVGMNGVVAKPIQLDQFRLTISTILQPSSAAATAEESCQVPEPALRDGVVLDHEFIKDRLTTLGEGTFLAILRIGQRSVAEALVGVEQSLATGKALSLAKAAHRLAGAASNFGYAGLFSLSQQIERLAESQAVGAQGQAFALAGTVPTVQDATDAALRDWLAAQGLSLS